MLDGLIGNESYGKLKGAGQVLEKDAGQQRDIGCQGPAEEQSVLYLVDAEDRIVIAGVKAG